MANSIRKKDALEYHEKGRPGKIEVVPTKEAKTQRDLSLAYSPGVAEPCKEIAANKENVYLYTAKGNLVGVISNGTAVLGLGDIGPEAGKPVMEGKGVLFKIFADIDVFDIEINEKDPVKFVEIVRALEPTFGGINLEDIKAPECFYIEKELREQLTIPVMHDDQHGTAIISAAALLNALQIQKKKIDKVRFVVNGAGAAAMACVQLYVALGAKAENFCIFDRKGSLYTGRTDLEGFKLKFANANEDTTLDKAMKGADVFIGLSVGNVVTVDMVKSMAKNPIVFAMANPDPEISWNDACSARNDIIMATGRSDYPNQVNNVLGFPYIFRGALDVRATQINEAMKLAAVKALADLAREDVPDEVAAAYQGSRPRFGRDYIIPVPFDPRLIATVPPAVAKAAMDTEVARRPIVDARAYKATLSARRDPIAGTLNGIFERVRKFPKRVVFAEGEEEQVIRAATSYVNQGLGTAILVGREDRVLQTAEAAGLDLANREGIEIHNARLSHRNSTYAQFLYERLQRRGFLFRDCQRMINQDRNHFAASMVALGDADAMVTGLTRNYSIALNDIRHVIDAKPGHRVIGISICLARGRTVIVADTAITEMPGGQDIAEIAIEAAGVARRLGYEPRVALLAFSTFGQPPGERAEKVQAAVRILDGMRLDFEYDGDIAADVALNRELMAQYPFCRLTGPANVLVMPAFHSASISTKMLEALGGATVIGPLIVGLDKPVQIVSLGSTDADIVNMAALAGFNIGG